MQKMCFYRKIKNCIAIAKSRGSGVFEDQGRCLRQVMTLDLAPILRHTAKDGTEVTIVLKL